MSSIITAGHDISTLMQFQKSQLAYRLANMNVLDHQVTDIFEAISVALEKFQGGEPNTGFSIEVQDQNKLTLSVDIPADVNNQQPAVKGSLLMDVKSYESNRLSLNSIKFTGANADNDLVFELKGSLSVSSSTELTGQVTEVSVSTLDQSKLLLVTGPRALNISSDESTHVKGIQYTEAGITTEITGKLNIDANNELQGVVASLRIHDSHVPKNSVQWSGDIDYASLQAKSGALSEIKDLFASHDMAPLFSKDDFFNIQRTDTLSESGAALQTVWHGFDSDDFMIGGMEIGRAHV
mgnify:FL=1